MSECQFQGNLRSRNIYLRRGVAVGGAAAALVLIAQIHSGMVMGWSRGFLWLPLWVFFLGFLQAREKTCAFMAAQGMQDCEGGVCPIDPTQRGQARHAALWILSRSFIYATLSCALILWILERLSTQA